MIRYILLFCITILALTSCRTCSSGGNDKEFDIPQDLLNDDVPNVVISSEVINEMVNVSSPIETAALIKSLKIPFNRDYLASTKYASNYSTNFKKALGLGIYGADMGYLNMYGNTSIVLDYLATVNSLADGLQVGQFFDFSTLKRIATNKENLDSLMLISQQSFNKIDGYLKETNRSSLSVVIIAGVWIEGLYLSTRVAESSKHERIFETIGEQKVIMSSLMVLLDIYKSDPNIAKLISDFEDIRALYKDVKITYEIGEPTTVEKNGVITFLSNDKQTVNMSDETLKAIISKVQKVRNQIVEG
jgi:hypothetical protein